MGETREERLLQFLEEDDTPVIGLREPSMLSVENGTCTLRGTAAARIFRRGVAPAELAPGSKVEF
jgi:dipeptidase E